MANKYIQKYDTTAEYEAATKENPNVSFVVETNKIYYNGDEHQIPIDYSTKYLTFKAIDSGTFKFSGNSVSYSVDGGSSWTSLASNTDTQTVSAGSEIMWKASGITPTSSAGIGTFSSTGRFEVYGNAMSLVSGDSFTHATTIVNHQFKKIFDSCSRLISAENLVLPATTLAGGCYQGMFASCAGLTTPPALPATTLAGYCYESMFFNCRVLTTTPELPATTLADTCYMNMFSICQRITNAPQLPAATLATQCYYGMFAGCTSLTNITCLATNISASSCLTNWVNGVSATGTFTKAASMTGWSTGNNGIPSGWTVVDA